MLKKRERERAKETLKKARANVREAEFFQKNYNNVYYIPKIPTMRELDKMDDKDAKRVLRDLRTIKSHGDLKVKEIEDGVYRSKYEINRLKRMIKESDEKRAEKRERIDEKKIYGLMGSEYEVSTRPNQIDIKNLKGENFEKVTNRLWRELSEEGKRYKEEMYLTNYVNGVINVFGGIADVDEIINRLSKLDIEDFELITNLYEYLTLEFVYDKNQELQKRYKAYLKELDKAIESVRKPEAS